VATRLRQLGHVMPRREHLDALPRAEDDRSRLRFAERAQGRYRLFDQRMAERVAAALVVEGDGADILPDLGGDVGHPGAPSFVYPKISACFGEVDSGRIAAYTDGASALSGFQTAPPDLAILDIKIPRLDGAEALRLLRAKSDLRAIFLTSTNEVIDEVFALEMGADDFIRNPFSQRLLVERVKT